MRNEPRPWARHGPDSTIRAAGMREAIARVWYLNQSDVEQQLATYRNGRSLSSSFYHALDMRCTQRKLFDELVTAFGLHDVPIGRPRKMHR